MTDLLDADGYPTRHTLTSIREWSISDLSGLFAILRTAWHSVEWGWHEPDQPPHSFHISTGGWSGNEELIAALQMNTLAWMMTWQQSRRGGHYIFTIPNP